MNPHAEQVSYAFFRAKLAGAARRWRTLEQLAVRTGYRPGFVRAVAQKMLAARQLERRVVKCSGAVLFRARAA